VTQTELPHVTVRVERAAGQTYMLVFEGKTVGAAGPVALDNRTEADALAATIRAGALLLEPAGPKTRAELARRLREAADEIEAG
jgi:hypothetical protein